MSSHPEHDQHERRIAPRYTVRAYASLQKAPHIWNAHLLDISATGARLAILDEHALQSNDIITFDIELEELIPNPQYQLLKLEGKIVHLRDHIIGIMLTKIEEEDRESFENLLIEFSQIKS